MNRRRSSLRRMLFLAVVFVLTVVLAVLFYRKYQQGSTPVTEKMPQSDSGQMVTLLFADLAGDGLMPEIRQIDRCDTTPECVDAVLLELMNGPLTELGATLPPSFSVRNVAIADGEAVVDLEKGSLDDLPAGSSAEMTMVYSIVNTINRNFPEVRKVKFLLEGAEISTLKGHLDLRQGLAPDPSLEKKKE